MSSNWFSAQGQASGDPLDAGELAQTVVPFDVSDLRSDAVTLTGNTNARARLPTSYGIDLDLSLPELDPSFAQTAEPMPSEGTERAVVKLNTPAAAAPSQFPSHITTTQEDTSMSSETHTYEGEITLDMQEAEEMAVDVVAPQPVTPAVGGVSLPFRPAEVQPAATRSPPRVEQGERGIYERSLGGEEEAQLFGVAADGARVARGQPRTHYFVKRREGLVSPLIAADELPPWLVVRGLERTAPEATVQAGSAVILGPHARAEGCWEMFAPDGAMGSRQAGTPAESSCCAHDHGTAAAAASAAPTAAPSIISQRSRAPSVAAPGLVPSQAEWEDRVGGLGAHYEALLHQQWARQGKPLPQGVALEGSAAAASAFGHQVYNPMTKGVFGRKIFCSHWLRTGECDFTQQGCNYLHIMPDLQTMEAMGMKQYPRWFREMPRQFQLEQAVKFDPAGLEPPVPGNTFADAAAAASATGQGTSAPPPPPPASGRSRARPWAVPRGRWSRNNPRPASNLPSAPPTLGNPLPPRPQVAAPGSTAVRDPQGFRVPQLPPGRGRGRGRARGGGASVVPSNTSSAPGVVPPAANPAQWQPQTTQLPPPPPPPPAPMSVRSWLTETSPLLSSLPSPTFNPVPPSRPWSRVSMNLLDDDATSLYGGHAPLTPGRIGDKRPHGDDWEQSSSSNRRGGPSDAVELTSGGELQQQSHQQQQPQQQQRSNRRRPRSNVPHPPSELAPSRPPSVDLWPGWARDASGRPLPPPPAPPHALSHLQQFQARDALPGAMALQEAAVQPLPPVDSDELVYDDENDYMGQ